MTRIRLPIFGIIVGALFLLMPGLAMLRNQFQVNAIYAIITSNGIGSPRDMLQDFQTIKTVTAIGCVLGSLGLVILLISLAAFSKACTQKKTQV